MPNLRVELTANAGDWLLQWYDETTPIADPVKVPSQTANQLGFLGRTIAQAFEHRGADGLAPLPFAPSTALDHTGVQLRDLCFGPIAARLADENGPQRLTIVSDLPAALNLPWELLPVGPRGERLGCHKDWGVFRSPADAPPPPPIRRGRPMRILFLAAAPLDQHALDYEKEEEAILRATATLQGAQLFTAELGSFEELVALVQRVRPHVVHLSGHGAVDRGVGRFCFEDDTGQSDARAAEELARVLKDHDVPCVFLNGCQTSQADVAGMCQALTRAGLPLALGWAASVADERATAFVETFYRELLAGEPVPAAAALARARIQREGLLPRTADGETKQELTFLLPQLYAAQPVEVLFAPQGPQEAYKGMETRYELLPGGVKGLREGFVGRRREQQRLLPGLRTGTITVLLLHGVGGQGKSTLATRLVDRLRGSGFDVRAVLSKRGEEETAATCATRAAAALVTEVGLAAEEAGKQQLAALLGDEGKPLARRLLLAADALAQLQCVLVLDNFEDVLELGPDGKWHVADPELGKFYLRVQTQLTSALGGRVVVTSRYLPAQTRVDLDTVCVVAGLNDFKVYEFQKLLKRDARVAERIRKGELEISLLNRLYAFAGGTPRFLERLRTLLRTFAAADLEAALDASGGKLLEARDQYLQDHFGPKLFALLGAPTQTLVSRLSLSDLPLPDDALEGLTGLDGGQLDGAVRQGVEFSLLQVFEESQRPPLHLPPGVWRGWLAERLSDDERLAGHGVLAAFWRTVSEKNREPELRITIIDGLLACRSHGKQAGSSDLWHWASTRLSLIWERIAEWRAARAVLEEIPESERDALVWHMLAILHLHEGNYPEAREQFGKALVMHQQIVDLAGEATTWHNLATIDLNEGNYAAAREQFGKALAIEQQIGNRAGEASTLANLATIDLREGNYAAAREQFGKALAMLQQIGDRAGEAATWHQLATMDLNDGNYAAAREQFGKALAMRRHGSDQGNTLRRLLLLQPLGIYRLTA
jgi:tetratricopeptide (TPR) repeat protein